MVLLADPNRLVHYLQWLESQAGSGDRKAQEWVPIWVRDLEEARKDAALMTSIADEWIRRLRAVVA
jgi:hypothetical protein